ncbi:MAG: putative peptidoglycan glycosyltransferase FtsW [Acidobacteria bacterium]|nr:putative peptidoglycan glycosyltransferase FtsW [Acidobacteriota bacterium]
MTRTRVDMTLFLCIVAMVGAGLIILYSASSVVAQLKYKSNFFFIGRQAGWAVAGFVCLMLLKNRDYRELKTPKWAFGAIGIVVALLLLVLVIDTKSHRWIRMGALSLQPSEFAKPALAIFLAFFVSQRADSINKRKTLVTAAVALGLPVIAIAIGDLGTAVVLVATAAVVFYVAGLERKFFVAAAGLTLMLLILAVVWKPYRVQRIIGYLDPDYAKLEMIGLKDRVKRYAESSNSPRDPSYHARQSKIAVGSGGVTGLGLMRGRQKLFFLPEAHTDFIYAVASEELGLVGGTALLFGFMVICWRGLRLYWIAADDFGKNLALAITTCLVIQALTNMSVVLDMAPTKGIPLPMISYGGSSLLSTLISMGLLLSVSDRAG